MTGESDHGYQDESERLISIMAQVYGCGDSHLGARESWQEGEGRERVVAAAAYTYHSRQTAQSTPHHDATSSVRTYAPVCVEGLAQAEGEVGPEHQHVRAQQHRTPHRRQHVAHLHTATQPGRKRGVRADEYDRQVGCAEKGEARLIACLPAPEPAAVTPRPQPRWWWWVVGVVLTRCSMGWAYSVLTAMGDLNSWCFLWIHLPHDGPWV